MGNMPATRLSALNGQLMTSEMCHLKRTQLEVTLDVAAEVEKEPASHAAKLVTWQK